MKGVPLRNAYQSAVQPIRPRVIGAGNPFPAVPFRAIEQARGAMAAHIVKAADRAAVAAQRYDGLAEKVEAVVVAEGGDIVLVADELPARAENGLLLGLEEFRILVDPG